MACGVDANSRFIFRLTSTVIDREINNDEMRNAEDLITYLIERRSRIDSKGEVSTELLTRLAPLLNREIHLCFSIGCLNEWVTMQKLHIFVLF